MKSQHDKLVSAAVSLIWELQRSLPIDRAEKQAREILQEVGLPNSDMIVDSAIDHLRLVKCI